MRKWPFFVFLLFSPGLAAGSGGIAHKLFVGTFVSAQELSTKLKQEVNVTQAVSTVVPCVVGTQFGAAYVLKISRKLARQSKTQNFVETWYYPTDSIEGETSAATSLPVMFKNKQSDPIFSGWQLTEIMGADHDIRLMVTLDDSIYLEHTFRVLGCTESSIEELAAELVSEDLDKLVCVEESRSGTRIKQNVCRTKRGIAIERERSVKQMENSRAIERVSRPPPGG